MTTTPRERQKQKAWVAGFISGLNAEEMPPIRSTDLQDAANKGFQAGAAARDIDESDPDGFVLELNKFHDDKGRFSSQKDATTASVTTKVAKERGIKPERGKVSKSTGKVSALYGANTSTPDKQAGRVDFKTSKPKKKTRSLKDYPRNYEEMDLDEVMEPADDAYVRALVRQELEAVMRERGSSESMSLGSLMVRKSRPSRRSHRNKKRQISTSRDQKQ
jgi:hypothetical protein